MLSKVELKKSKEIKDKNKLKQYIISHCLLNIILKKYTKNIYFEYNQYNKLYLKNSSINFSLSHSNNYFLLGISNYDIGVDIEFIRETNYKRIVEKYFHNNEKNKVNNLKSFFQIWTKKEALYKLLEREKNYKLNSFDLSNNSLIINNNKIFFRTLFFLENYIFSISLYKNNSINIILRNKIY